MDRQSMETRDKLLRAATHVFARKGYEGSTVRRICARAGVNVAAVNYHFGGKENLYAAVLERIFALAEQNASSAWKMFTDESLSPEKRLGYYVAGMMGWIYGCQDSCVPGGCGREECGDMGAVYIIEMLEPTPAMERLIDAYIRPEAEMLCSVVAALLGPKADDERVWACMGSVAGQMLHYLYSWEIIIRLYPDVEPTSRRLEFLCRHITEFSLAGIAGVRAGLEG